MAQLSITTLRGATVVINLADWRERALAVYRELNHDVALPEAPSDGSRLKTLSEKIELRGFDAAIFVPEAAKRPTAQQWLSHLPETPHHREPLFVNGVEPTHVSTANQDRPDGAYLLLASFAPTPEHWSLGLTPQAILDILKPSGEQGMTFGEYILLERLHADALNWQAPGERLDERLGSMLLGAALPDGRMLTIDNSIAGRMIFGALRPDEEHPRYGARVGAIIQL
jgi:hypothetical protein